MRRAGDRYVARARLNGLNVSIRLFAPQQSDGAVGSERMQQSLHSSRVAI